MVVLVVMGGWAVLLLLLAWDCRAVVLTAVSNGGLVVVLTIGWELLLL